MWLERQRERREPDGSQSRSRDTGWTGERQCDLGALGTAAEPEFVTEDGVTWGHREKQAQEDSSRSLTVEQALAMSYLWSEPAILFPLQACPP